MVIYSPLRYPGGKNRLSKFISLVCEKNSINGHYIEPYAGGASVALYLLIEGCISKITINDLDRSIYAFWYSVTHYTYDLCELIAKTDINLENWRKQKEIQKIKHKANLLKLGFSTLFLNRTNISGILDAGIIGGKSQTGKYKMDCRFNKQAIINKIKKIASFKNYIRVYNLDAVELINKVTQKNTDPDTIFYFDPPYFLKGQSLYMNHYKSEDHKQVSKQIKKIKNAKWIISYDNVRQIRKLYKGYRKLEYKLNHSARNSRIGEEILFFCHALKKIPTSNFIHI